MIKISKVKMNYQKELVGVTSMPQFGWVIDSNERNVVQKTYQIQLSLFRDFSAVLYDSGVVESEESAHVFLKDCILQSATKYYVRVRISDLHDNCSEFSEPVSFVTALLDNREWKAFFITAETELDAKISKGTCLRKDFMVRHGIREAWAFTTALGLYQFYLNGTKVGEDELTPGWTSYHKHLLYQTYNVTNLLKEGRNTAGAMLGAGWYKGVMGFMGRRNNYGTRTAFLGQILIRYEDGATELVCTDDSWRGSDAPVVFSEIYDGEIYNGALEQKGWKEAGFQDIGWRRTEIIDFNKEVLTAQGASRVKQIDRLEAVSIFKTPAGDTCVDFGQNLTGFIIVRAKGRKGEKIELNCFEVLDSQGNAYFANLRSAKETLIYYFGEDGEICWHPSFTFQGFRYARIASWPGQPGKESFTACSVHSELEPAGSFLCSNPDLNQLHHNILWGLKGNFVDIPTDCPSGMRDWAGPEMRRSFPGQHAI